MTFEILALVMTLACVVLCVRFIFFGGDVLKEWGLEQSTGALILFRRMGLMYLGLALMFFLGRNSRPLGHPHGGMPGHGRSGHPLGRSWCFRVPGAACPRGHLSFGRCRGRTWRGLHLGVVVRVMTSVDPPFPLASRSNTSERTVVDFH